MVASNQNVSEGYKMTELGEIPVEWKVNKISDLANVKTGGTPSKNKSEYWENGKIRWMTSGEVNLKKVYDVKERITELGYQNSNVSLLPVKTIMMALNGQGKTRGTVAILEVETTCNQSLAGILPSEKFNSDYLYYYLESSYERLRSITGEGRSGLNLGLIKDFTVISPNINEQQKIAEILSTVDKQIENTEQLIEKTKELKKGLMQQLLTKGIGHKEYKQTELGEIPVEWEVNQFINITNVLKCGVASTPKYVEQGIPFLSSQNVKENRIILDKYNFISKEYHEELTRKVLPRKGDILYTRVGANFGKAAVVNLDFEFSVYVSLTLIRLKENYSEQFYTYLLNSEKYQRMAKNKVFQGGGVPNLNVGEVEKFPMVIPPLEEQQKIASILSSVDEQIESYEQEKDKYLELKKGLMQQLLTGKIRVTV